MEMPSVLYLGFWIMLLALSGFIALKPRMVEPSIDSTLMWLQEDSLKFP